MESVSGLPAGKGQSGLIVAPPKAGKTKVMKTIALAIGKAYPDIQFPPPSTRSRPALAATTF